MSIVEFMTFISWCIHLYQLINWNVDYMDSRLDRNIFSWSRDILYFLNFLSHNIFTKFIENKNEKGKLVNNFYLVSCVMFSILSSECPDNYIYKNLVDHEVNYYAMVCTKF